VRKAGGPAGKKGKGGWGSAGIPETNKEDPNGLRKVLVGKKKNRTEVRPREWP